MRWGTAAFILTGFACQPQTASSVSLTKATSTELNYDLGNKLVQWSGGALSAVEANGNILPMVRLFGRDGIQLAVLPVNIPDAKTTAVYCVARGGSGLVAMVGSAGEYKGTGIFFIALYPADGSVRTTPGNGWNPDVFVGFVRFSVAPRAMNGRDLAFSATT